LELIEGFGGNLPLLFPRSNNPVLASYLHTIHTKVGKRELTGQPQWRVGVNLQILPQIHGDEREGIDKTARQQEENHMYGLAGHEVGLKPSCACVGLA